MSGIAVMAGLNSRQTKRCVRYLRAVRLLGEVIEQSEPVCSSNSRYPEEYVMSAELYEQIGEVLADIHAAEIEAAS